MESTTTPNKEDNSVTDLSSSRENEEAIGISRENSDSQKPIETSSGGSTITADNAIVSDNVAIGRAVLTEGIEVS